MPISKCLPLGHTSVPLVSNLLFYLEALETSWLFAPVVKEYSISRIQRSFYPCSSGRMGATLSRSNNNKL